MKQMPNSLTEIKQQILLLKGKVVKLDINRGRRKTATFRAMVEDIYPSVFTVRQLEYGEDITNTYSYSDILCGEVKIDEYKETI